jgi:hypothetical protein
VTFLDGHGARDSVDHQETPMLTRRREERRARRRIGLFALLVAIAILLILVQFVR